MLIDQLGTLLISAYGTWLLCVCWFVSRALSSFTDYRIFDIYCNQLQTSNTQPISIECVSSQHAGCILCAWHLEPTPAAGELSSGVALTA